MDSWEQISGDAFRQLGVLKQLVKGYSYETTETSLRTDEKLCTFITISLSSAKKLLYNISDLLFSLHLGEGLLDPIADLRDQVDILSDEIQVRHCMWKDIPPEYLLKIIKHDFALTEKVKRLNMTIEILFNGILNETKKSRGNRSHRITPAFWHSVEQSMTVIQSEIRELAILFMEREVMCNIRPITLDRTFQELQKEIRRRL